MPSRIERLDASVGVTSNEDELTVDIAHVSLRAVEPEFGVNALSGVIRRTENTVILENVSLRTEESSLRVDGTIRNIEGRRPYARSQGLVRQVGRRRDCAKSFRRCAATRCSRRSRLRRTGPLDRLAVDVNVREAKLGQATGDLTVDADGADRRVAGTVSMEHLNVGALMRQRGGLQRRLEHLRLDQRIVRARCRSAREATQSAPLKSDITGQAHDRPGAAVGPPAAERHLSVNAGRAQVAGYEARNLVANGRIDGEVIRVNATAAAYGGRATAVGTVTTGQPLALDLTGRAANVDLRNLPPVLNAPGVPSDLQFTYTLTGRGRAFSGDVQLDASTLAGRVDCAGHGGQFSVGGGAPRYAGQGPGQRPRRAADRARLRHHRRSRRIATGAA